MADVSPTAAERLAIRTVHSAVLDGAHPLYSLTDQVVFTLGAAGLLANSSTVAAVEHTVRGQISMDVDRAVQRNARCYPDDSGMAARRLGMRVAQRIVTEPLASPLTLYVFELRYRGDRVGVYITRTAAREHAESDVHKLQPGAVLSWPAVEGAPDTIEMFTVERTHTCATGYTVTTVKVETTPDTEASA